MSKDALQTLDEMYLQRMCWSTYISPRFFRRVDSPCGPHCLKGCTLDYFDRGVGKWTAHRWRQHKDLFSNITAVRRELHGVSVVTYTSEEGQPCRFYDLDKDDCRIAPFYPLFCALRPVQLRKVPGKLAASLTAVLPEVFDYSRLEHPIVLSDRIRALEELEEIGQAVGVSMIGYHRAVRILTGYQFNIAKGVHIPLQIRPNLFLVYRSRNG